MMKFDFLSGTPVRISGPEQVISAHDMLVAASGLSNGSQARAVVNGSIYGLDTITLPGFEITRSDGITARSPWCIVHMNREHFRPDQETFDDHQIILRLRSIDKDIMDHIQVMSMFHGDQIIYPVIGAHQDDGLVLDLHRDHVSLKIDAKIKMMGSTLSWWSWEKRDD